MTVRAEPVECSLADGDASLLAEQVEEPKLFGIFLLGYPIKLSSTSGGAGP